MGQCKCGHTRDAEKNCDGTHKVVKAIKQEITDKMAIQWQNMDDRPDMTYVDGFAEAISFIREEC